jgi:2-oxo-4-hydroxy-4-carboxy--5-ureidoimidazoline (OHCU) decarboxylase
MSGAQLSHAARTMFDVYRASIAVALHLDDVVDAHPDLADFIEAAGDLAADLQRRADAYADRRSNPERRRASA